MVQALLAAGANKEAREYMVSSGGHWDVGGQQGGVFIMRQRRRMLPSLCTGLLQVWHDAPRYGQQ